MEITLRPAKVEDTEVIARWSADRAGLAQWAGPEAEFPLGRDQMAAWLAEKSGPRPRHSFVAVDRSGTPIGHFQLAHDALNETVRIARFVVAPERRGSGFGTELFGRIVAMAFRDLGAHRVELAVMVTNEVARRLYESAGFVHEGTARESSMIDGRRASISTMSLLRPEWAVLAGAEAVA